ncbi:MAG: hypothetical protein ACHBNF_04625 [Chromatiales bacterium]
MTAQARSQDLDTYNLVLLVDHLGKFVDLIGSFVHTRCGIGHRGYYGGLLLGSVITSVDDAQALFGDMASDIQSWDKARPIDSEDALTPRLAKLQYGTAPLRSLRRESAPVASSAVDKIDLAEMGLKGMAVIFYGKTEAAMVAALREAGMLSEDLITHPMHDDQEVS